jgi:hypothetical protein
MSIEWNRVCKVLLQARAETRDKTSTERDAGGQAAKEIQADIGKKDGDL